jgi:hypothetical protein
MGVAVLGRKAIFAGGNGADGSVYSAVADVYDTTTRQVSTAPFTRRDASLGVAVSGTHAFFAGGDSFSDPSTEEAVDIYTDTAPSPVLSGAIRGAAGRTDLVTVWNSGDADLPAGATVNVYASPDRTLRAAIAIP